MQIKRLSIAMLAVVSIICSGCSTTYENFLGQNNISPIMQQGPITKSDESRYIFNLTGDENKQAIFKGKKANINEYLDAQYKLSPGHISCSAWVMALMPVNMLAEAHCQESRGINAWKMAGNENVRKTKIS